MSDTKMPGVTQDIINLYDEFTHAPLQRRVFMERLAKLAGSAAAAQALLVVLENNYAHAAVAESDSRITVEDTTFPAAGMDLNAHIAVPKGTGKVPAIIVIHENRGLNPHTKDVARRFAVEGFLAIAPDALSPLGGYPGDEDKARELFGKIDAAQTTKSFAAAVEYAAKHPRSTGKVGAVGFCWGGGMVNQLITINPPGLAAGVAFYGMQAKADQVPSIKVPLQLHYASLDERINAGIGAYEDALKANKVNYETHMYEGVNHAFFNDANAARYNEAAAAQAWQRTLDFFRKNLA